MPKKLNPAPASPTLGVYANNDIAEKRISLAERLGDKA